MLKINLAERWPGGGALVTQEGGEHYGVGAGVGISRFRANLGIADDLLGSREE